MTPPELCFNLWFLVDIATGLAYGWCGRVYALTGNEEAKLELLRQLAETDYVTATREKFPKEWKLVRDGRTLEGYLTIGQFNQALDQHLEYFAGILEAALPPRPRYIHGPVPSAEPIAQYLPKDPLFVATVLMENDRGEIRPFTTPENKAWTDRERIRLNYL
ncbi:glycoside hydrolase family protein [Flaviaesturariibacter terrae]